MSDKLFDTLDILVYHTDMNTKNKEDVNGDELRVSIREYIRNYKKYNNIVKSTGQIIVITSNKKDDVELILRDRPEQKRYTFDDFKNLTFKGGKYLSRDVDKIVYGI